jgi:hypothetical protein
MPLFMAAVLAELVVEAKPGVLYVVCRPNAPLPQSSTPFFSRHTGVEKHPARNFHSPVAYLTCKPGSNAVLNVIPVFPELQRASLHKAMRLNTSIEHSLCQPPAQTNQ